MKKDDDLLDKVYKKMRNLILNEADTLLQEAENIPKPRPADIHRLPYYAIFISTEKLTEAVKELEASSRRIERLTARLEKWTWGILALTSILILYAFLDLIFR